MAVGIAGGEEKYISHSQQDIPGPLNHLLAMTQAEEARQSPRKLLRARAVMVDSSGNACTGRLMDIGTTGLSIMLDRPTATGSRHQIRFDMFMNGASQQFRLDGKVVYSILAGKEGFRTGIQFTDLVAEQSALIAKLLASA